MIKLDRLYSGGVFGGPQVCSMGILPVSVAWIYNGSDRLPRDAERQVVERIGCLRFDQTDFQQCPMKEGLNPFLEILSDSRHGGAGLLL